MVVVQESKGHRLASDSRYRIEAIRKAMWSRYQVCGELTHPEILDLSHELDRVVMALQMALTAEGTPRVMVESPAR